MSGEDTDREAESRRILAQVAREAEADGAAAHIAKDADKEDWADKIARGVAVVLLIGLLTWLILSLMLG